MADQTPGPPTYADARRRYRLESLIATGGMGQVWRATDTVLDRLVAVKQLLQAHEGDPVFRSRFETEARHAAGLHHPNIAQVYDFGAGDETHPPFLVMEYVDGKPLSAILRPGQPMDAAAAANVVAATADALGAAHAQGIVHRDVKPANILVTADRQVKITDFGIARAADGVALTRTGEVLGTPQYLSPEQAEGKPATPASDVYALGAVAYECLVGQRPFQAENAVATALAHLREPVPELPSTVPPALASVVRRALAKAPDERYPDGAVFAAALRDAVESPAHQPLPPAPAATTTLVMSGDPADPLTTTHARHPVASSSAASLARRVPIPVWAAAGVLLVVVAVAAVAGLTTSGAGNGPGTNTSSRPPASPPSSPTSGLSGSTSSSGSGPTTSKSPGHGKTPPGHGHGHGHKHGKGDQ